MNCLELQTLFSAELHLVSFFCAGFRSSQKIPGKIKKGFLKKNKPRSQKTPRGGGTPGAGAGPTRGWALARGRGAPLPLGPRLSAPPSLITSLMT